MIDYEKSCWPENFSNTFPICSSVKGFFRIPLTPAAYAARATAMLPACGEEIAAIVRCYLAARYERDADSAQLSRLRERVRSFRPRGAPA